MNWEEEAVAYSSCCPDICVEEVSYTNKNLSQNLDFPAENQTVYFPITNLQHYQYTTRHGHEDQH
jgi:hypothetical protein